MKIRRPRGPRTVAFDCPWEGHVADPRFTLRNSSAPGVIGLRCLKCGCLIYEFVAQPEEPSSALVSADGGTLPTAADGGERGASE